MSKIIKLTQGYTSTIDDEDEEKVEKHSWCVQQYKDKTRNTKIYAKCSMKGTQITLHRFILNPPKGIYIDHINGDGLDNRRSNLRFCTKQDNAANRPKDRIKGATSIFKGVYKNKNSGKWIARITVKDKGIYLGCFSVEIDAARAYNEAAIKYFGKFSCLNQLP